MNSPFTPIPQREVAQLSYYGFMRKKEVLRCQSCFSNCARNGKHGQKQRWKCKNCGKTQFRQYKINVLKQERETAIQNLCSEAVGIRSIGRLLGYAPSYIVKIIKRIAKHIKKPIPFEYGQEYELDEMWSYEGNKKNGCWLMWIVNRKTRQVIDFIIGRRTKVNLEKLLSKLKALRPKTVRTDYWSGYKESFRQVFGNESAKLHKAGRRITNHIERGHLTLRTQIKRLGRKTINYSKSVEMFKAIMLLYFDAKRWTI